MIDKITIQPRVGVSIDEAKAEAIKVAMEHKCTVVFYFNDLKYVTTYHRILEAFQEQEVKNNLEK